MENQNKTLNNVFLTEKDIVVVKLKSSNTALMCTTCKCLSGVTLSYVGFREFEKTRKIKNLDESFNVNYYEIDNTSSVVITSSLSSRNIQTEVFQLNECGHLTLSWKTIEKTNDLEKQ